MKKILLLSIVAVAVTVVATRSYLALGAEADGGRDFPGVVFVASQGLYYDTFVAAEELPPRGPFQLLVEGETDFGPGDRGYLGGRWKVPNDEGGFDYFLCPLLPPGRLTP